MLWALFRLRTCNALRKHQQINSDTNNNSEASYPYNAKNGQCHYKQIMFLIIIIVLVFAAYIHICKL